MKQNKISLTQLERFLDGAANILRGSVDASEYKEFIFGLLFIKRLSDQFDQHRKDLVDRYIKMGLPPETIAEYSEKKEYYGDKFFVPASARWEVIKDLKKDIAASLDQALAIIEEENDEISTGLLRIEFNGKRGEGFTNAQWKKLIDHFNDPNSTEEKKTKRAKDPLLESETGFISNFRLTNDNFEFPDLLGAAYEYLIKYFADSAGKKGGEFYTPNEVVRLLVRLIKPQEGNSIYDPTAGSGGMLIQSSQYVEENGGDTKAISLYGQERNPGVWTICVMNMILHNIIEHKIENGDTLIKPIHREGTYIRQFDRVIANPPFSQGYTQKEMEFKQRFIYGMAPEKGKKGDLMFVQHMIASLAKNGMMAVVMPHGVLFRGGKEQEIRKKILLDNKEELFKATKEELLTTHLDMLRQANCIIEAIIGLPPKLFYGTGIPASVIIINKNKPVAFRSKILFINAEGEYDELKKQYKLRHQDIERITFVFDHKIEIDKYSRLVPLEEIAAKDFSLNIRGYVDNTPEPDPENVKAHLLGGIPCDEIASKSIYFSKFNFNPSILFPKWNNETEGFTYFADTITAKDQIRKAIIEDADVLLKEATLQTALDSWWEDAVIWLKGLAPQSIDTIKNQITESDTVFTSDGIRQYLTLGDNKKLPALRIKLLAGIKQNIVPCGILDEFQAAGVFAGWWEDALQGIKYDLKTVSASGWVTDLIPDELVINHFFAAEKAELVKLENSIALVEAKIEELFDDSGFEEDEDNKKSMKNIVDFLETEIENLTDFAKENKLTLDDQEQLKLWQSVLKSLKENGKELKDLNKIYAEKEVLLELKVYIKKFGLEPNEMKKDRYKSIYKTIGGEMTDKEAEQLILLKWQQIISGRLQDFINKEKRLLIAAFEQLFEKYFAPSAQLDLDRESAILELNGYLKSLKYLSV